MSEGLCLTPTIRAFPTLHGMKRRNECCHREPEEEKSPSSSRRILPQESVTRNVHEVGGACNRNPSERSQFFIVPIIQENVALALRYAVR